MHPLLKTQGYVSISLKHLYFQLTLLPFTFCQRCA